MSQWLTFMRMLGILIHLFDLVRRPCGLHGSRLLSAGNLSHHLRVYGLPGPPGHTSGDTVVLYQEQPTDFLWKSALPRGQGQHPRHPWCQPLWCEVSNLWITPTKHHIVHQSVSKKKKKYILLGNQKFSYFLHHLFFTWKIISLSSQTEKLILFGFILSHFNSTVQHVCLFS